METRGKRQRGKTRSPSPRPADTREHGLKVLNSFFNVIDAWRQ